MLRPLLVLRCVVLLCSLCASAEKFPVNKCAAPYNEDAVKKLPIEAKCGLKGDAKPDSAEAPQNQFKNNLCASGSNKNVSADELIELQGLVDATHLRYGNVRRGRGGPPKDRNVLQDLGPLKEGEKLAEGDVVTIVGYLVESHYMPKSQSGSGETVNCHRTDHESADIHLAISNEPMEITRKEPTQQRQAKLCHTISAEMIPHLRPSVWNTDVLGQVTQLGRPIRVKGQLFFDGSHEPCDGDVPNPGDPARITVWEIHPVYSFEVCKNDEPERCRIDRAADWLPVSSTPDLEIRDDEEQ